MKDQMKIEDLQLKVQDLEKLVLKYENLLEDINNACLCERFKTKGFDYGQKHRLLGPPDMGARWNTPKALIEGRIGFDWIYEKPEGVCNSHKQLKLSKYK